MEKETNFIVLHTQDLNVTEKVKKKIGFVVFLLLFPYVVDFYKKIGVETDRLFMF